jgi:pimeloyl-ACP methyl ester carboxylesterase
MGRNKQRPKGYAPYLEFDLRRDKEGGDVLVPSVFGGLLSARTRHECLILIHGFNNTDSEAAEAYFGFRNRETQIFGPSDPFTWENRFGDTFWPGDADWWSFFDKLDFLIYPKAVHTTLPAANALATLLWQMPNLERIDLIAHSLGCRVVLEALLLLRNRPLPAIRRIVLMAAAVPSEMLERGGRFYDLLAELVAAGTTIHVLHSRQDIVLHYAFPPGQLLAGASEASVRALGRDGPTPFMPGSPGMLTEKEIPGAGHGDYWGPSNTDASRMATEEAGRFLALGDIGRQVGVERVIGFSLTGPDPREIGTSRELSEIG